MCFINMISIVAHFKCIENITAMLSFVMSITLSFYIVLTIESKSSN